jgi:type IV pilus assembly protein PilY1
LAASSTEAAGETVVFQARFRSGDWSGELAAYPYESIGDDDAAKWFASDGIPAYDQRVIYTLDDEGAGVAFAWNSLDTDARAALDDDEALLDYIRGDTSNEGGGSGDFRSRGGGVLGDIIHSTPAFVGDQSDGYSILSGTEGNGYRSFVNGKDDYDDVVLVGANDGMLHAFDADSGEEIFAYVPRSLLGELPELADQDYQHRYYVDGSPSVADAYIDGSWRTIAVTALGAGGPGAFAFDVTDPDAFDTGSILWEIAPDTVDMKQGQGSVEPGDYLGTAMGAPAIVRTESGDWVAIFGNGYNSVEGTAALIVVELASGEVLRVLDTGAGDDNGLATPLAIDRDRNGSVDTVYAGDFEGNLWKFDLSGDPDGDWSVEYDGDPLFTAEDGDGNAQSITARPDAILSPHGGVVVVFGTGKYLSDSDPLDDSTQSVYGIWDVEGVIEDDGTERTDTAVGGRGELQLQEVVNTTAIGDVNVRVISRNTVAYEGDAAVRGWVLDLSYSGERVNRDVTVFDGKAIMVSTVPNSDPCSFGGTSSLIEINPLTGTQFDEPLLDINQDGDFDTGDGVADETAEGGYVYPGIVDLDVGLATNPNILIREDNDHEKQITGSNLNTQMVGEKGYFRPGRASWQQIR